MERNVSFQIGGLDEDSLLRSWVKNKQKSTNDSKDELILQEKIRNSSVRRGDAQLHLAVRIGNLVQVKDILTNFQTSAFKGSIWKKNGNGETALLIASENGHAEIVQEILKAAWRQSANPNVDNSLDAFHTAAKLGHAEVLKELLNAVPELVKTTNSSNATAVYAAAAQGHINVVKLLLDIDESVASIARNNGKTALHIAARTGHLEVVRALIEKDPALSLKTDKKGQTALHMAAKGQNVMIVREFRNNVSSVIHIVDNKGNTALHTATRKGRPQIVRTVLSFPGIDVNALNKAGETALNIAEKYFNEDIASILREANTEITKNEEADPTPPRSPNQLKQAVNFIKQGFQFQLKRSQRTQQQVQDLKKKVRLMNFSGLNNAVNSVNVVATLIASVAFAAIFQVPGSYAGPGENGYSTGEADIATGSATSAAFIIFLISDSLALFVSLAVVMVQTSLVVIDTKALKMMVFVINKLMWACCISISVSFVSLSYVVIGQDDWWLMWSTVVVAALILLGTLGIMFYCVVTYRVQRKKIKNSIKKAVSGVGGSYARCRSLVTESLLKVECKQRVYAI